MELDRLQADLTLQALPTFLLDALAQPFRAGGDHPPETRSCDPEDQRQHADQQAPSTKPAPTCRTGHAGTL
jgi:hypothetical protein